ncbi:MAG: hypothetical protein KDC49_11255 [Saprospiraceae bacterium]|nr:hypothetical protein [Saprospiraceae bacterium]
MSSPKLKTHFAPELHIPKATFSLDFYTNFGAHEIFCLRNDDGSVHVAEFELDGATFHVHETMGSALEPLSSGGVTTVIGLFVDDVEVVLQNAILAGAVLINPTTDHEYGYRQAMFRDPFGHFWQVQKKI